jgi:hypothetical protein
LLLGVALFAFVIPRLIPTPPVMDAYGFYSGTGEESLETWASLPVQYVGSDLCQVCHLQNYKTWEVASHKGVNCEDCHGPGKEHFEDQAEPVIDRDRGFCAQCHDMLVSRPAGFPQVNMYEMGGDDPCIACHNPHDPRAGMPAEVPHTLEKHSDCMACHVWHGEWGELPAEVPHAVDERGDCLSCHGPEEMRGATLPRVPHNMQGRTDCFMCHRYGQVKPLPEDHFGRSEATCNNCHRDE